MPLRNYILPLIFLLSACTKYKQVDPVAYTIEQPSYFGTPNIPAANPMKAEIVALGKMLFFDKQLSRDNSVSCASCHSPQHAFADAGKVFSTGIEGKTGVRNAPALFNLAWSKAFFWDGGANSLENQAIAPITSHEEMDFPLAQLEKKLSAIPAYRDQFKALFGVDTVYATHIIMALAQYERTLVSANSKYDQYLSGKVLLSAAELDGLKIFQAECSSCHSGEHFTDRQYYNIGLDGDFTDPVLMDDPLWGRQRITLNPDDKGKYRTPTLRNLAFTAPYMHDGRLKNLDDVLDFFDHGIQKPKNLSPLLNEGIKLTQEEKTALLSFLETLNDYSFIQQ